MPPPLLRRACSPLVAATLGASALALAGCSAALKDSNTAAAPAAQAKSQPAAAGAGSAAGAADSTAGGSGNNSATAVNAVDASPAETGRKVVSSATLTVETEDLPTAKDKAAATVKAAGGDVYQESSSFGQRGTSVLTLKVPPEKFDEVLKALGGLGQLSKQEIKTEDVTQQVIDLDARIRSAEASVGSVQGFVGQSKNLVETAQLENELQRRIAELESLRAQRQNLERRVDLSTIVLTLESDKGTPAVEEARAPAPPAPPAGFSDGWRNGLDAAGNVVRVASVGLGAALPFSPLLLVGALLVRWRRRRRPAAAVTDVPPPPAPPAWSDAA